jgi:hypothetical protein
MENVSSLSRKGENSSERISHSADPKFCENKFKNKNCMTRRSAMSDHQLRYTF